MIGWLHQWVLLLDNGLFLSSDLQIIWGCEVHHLAEFFFPVWLACCAWEWYHWLAVFILTFDWLTLRGSDVIILAELSDGFRMIDWSQEWFHQMNVLVLSSEWPNVGENDAIGSQFRFFRGIGQFHAWEMLLIGYHVPVLISWIQYTGIHSHVSFAQVFFRVCITGWINCA